MYGKSSIIQNPKTAQYAYVPVLCALDFVPLIMFVSHLKGIGKF
jgi:hypothetical protein